MGKSGNPAVVADVPPMLNKKESTANTGQSAESAAVTDIPTISTKEESSKSTGKRLRGTNPAAKNDISTNPVRGGL